MFSLKSTKNFSASKCFLQRPYSVEILVEGLKFFTIVMIGKWLDISLRIR